MILWKSKLEKINAILAITFIAIVLLFIFRYFLIASLCTILFIILCPVWYRSLGEELIISFLKRKNGYCTYDELNELVEEYSEKMVTHTISRLKKQSIIEIRDDRVILINKNHVCAF